MCGIVGYLGPKNAVDVVMKGLARLEYRGYDSTGICIQQGDSLQIFKSVGKIGNLEKIMEEQDLFSRAGIGHTRWATHGEVLQENAHPHGDSEVAVIHNGIIENADELKEELLQNDHQFASDTDSEVFYHLVKAHLGKGHTLSQAVTASFKKVTGNSAFVIMDKKANEIMTIKKGAPTVCGDNDEHTELFVASDPYALVGHAERLYFPEDNVLCVLSVDQEKGERFLKFFELDGQESKRVLIRPQHICETEHGKNGLEHFMLKEIHEQPILIRQLANFYLKGEGFKQLEQCEKYQAPFTHIVACGTAWHAGLLIGQFIERFTQKRAQVELASEFRYRNPLLSQDEVALFISQSGETADTLAAETLCRQTGLKTLSIVNVEGSTLYRNCVENFLIKAGMEIGVASTKAFTLQVLTGYLFALSLKGPIETDTLTKDFAHLATKMEAILARTSEIKKIAKALYQKKGFIFTARGKYAPIALEGALKLKEIAYVHAEGYAAGELKHGPIALIDDEMVNIALVGPELYEKTLSNLKEVKARRGIIIAIGPESVRSSLGPNDFLIPLDFSGNADLHPLYMNLVTQLLSYYMARAKGCDIDKPRNLAKSVTVE